MPPQPGQTSSGNPFAAMASTVAGLFKRRQDQQKTEEKITQEHQKQGRALQQIQERMQRIHRFTQAIAGIGAAGRIFGGFASQIAGMSTEGERMGKAFELLRKVIGEGLAPYFRAITAGVVQLARAYHSLDPAIKETVTTVIAWGAGLAAAAGAVGTLVVVLTPIVTAFASLGSAALAAGAALAAFVGWPALIVGGITALVAAIAGGSSAFGVFADGAMTMQERVTAVVEMILNTWTYFKAATLATWTYATEVIKGWADAVYQFAKPVIDWIGSAIKYLWDQLRALGAALGEFGLGVAKGLDPKAFEKASAAWQKAVAGLGQNKGLAQNLVGGVFGALNRAQQAFQNKAPMHWKVQVEFETLQGTWDRLQKAFISAEGENLNKAMLAKMGMAADGIQKMANQGVNINNLPPVVF